MRKKMDFRWMFVLALCATSTNAFADFAAQDSFGLGALGPVGPSAQDEPKVAKPTRFLDGKVKVVQVQVKKTGPKPDIEVTTPCELSAKIPLYDTISDPNARGMIEAKDAITQCNVLLPDHKPSVLSVQAFSMMFDKYDHLRETPGKGFFAGFSVDGLPTKGNFTVAAADLESKQMGLQLLSGGQGLDVTKADVSFSVYISAQEPK